MQVQVRVLFDKPTEDDWREMRSLANGLTSAPDSVRVLEDEKPEWLVAEFRIPTEAQDKAVDKIDRALRYPYRPAGCAVMRKRSNWNDDWRIWEANCFPRCAKASIGWWRLRLGKVAGRRFLGWLFLTVAKRPVHKRAFIRSFILRA